MKYWIGLIALAFAMWLLYSGLSHRRKVVEARRQSALAGVPAPPERHASLALLGDIMPSLMILGLAFIGAKLTLAYFVLGVNRVLSLVDLGGFLAMLACYGTWLILRTKYPVTELSALETAGDKPAFRVIDGAKPEGAHDGAHDVDRAVHLRAGDRMGVPRAVDSQKAEARTGGQGAGKQAH